MSAMNEPAKRPAQSAFARNLPVVLGASATTVVTALLLAAAVLHDRQLVVVGVALLIALIPSMFLLAGWMRFRRAALDPVYAAKSRYQAAIYFWGALYIVISLVVIWFGDLHIRTWPYWGRALASLAPVVPIAGIVSALLRYLSAETDEFQRMLTTRAVLLAAGAAFIFLTAWGFLQKFGAAPAFPMYAAMAPFWVAFAVVNPIVRWRYR